MAIQSEELVQLLTKGQRPVKPTPVVLSSTSRGEGGNTRAKLPPIKRLTPEEMKMRRDKNLCFNCDETYHFGHKCKRLFLVWVEDGDDELSEPLRFQEVEDDQKEPQVSLHAVAGYTHADTLKLLGRTANKDFVILLDSRSTHNFLDPNVARSLRCVVELRHHG